MGLFHKIDCDFSTEKWHFWSKWSFWIKIRHLWCEIAIFGVRNSLQKYICNNKRNLFIHKRLNKLSWIICIWIGLSFNWQNQADKAQETNLKRVQVRSTSFRPFFWAPTVRYEPPSRPRSLSNRTRDFGRFRYEQGRTVRYGMHSKRQTLQQVYLFHYGDKVMGKHSSP